MIEIANGLKKSKGLGKGAQGTKQFIQFPNFFSKTGLSFHNNNEEKDNRVGGSFTSKNFCVLTRKNN